MTIALIILGVLAVLLLLTYNNLVSKRTAIKKSIGTIDAELQRRFDLMSSLFSQAERVLDHESEVYRAIAKNRTGFDELRKSYDNRNNDIAAVQQIDRAVGSMFSGMRQIHEQYPELKTIDTINKVISENITVEENVIASRKQYNQNVEDYINAIQMFPNVLFAGILGFRDEYKMYEADAEAKKRPVPVYEDYQKEKYKQKIDDLNK